MAAGNRQTRTIRCKCGFTGKVSPGHRGDVRCPECRARLKISARPQPVTDQGLFHCSNCGLLKKIPARFIGKTAPCPHCGTRTAVVGMERMDQLWQQAARQQKSFQTPFHLRARLARHPALRKTIMACLPLVLGLCAALYFYNGRLPILFATSLPL